MKHFIKNISFYVVGYILVRAVSFILLPLFSNTLSESEYGTYSIIFIFIAFAQFLYSYGMDASLMRFFVKYEGKRKKVYSSIFLSIMCTSVMLSGLIWMFSDKISVLLLNENHGQLFKIAAYILFLDSFSFRILVIHRMEGNPLRYFFLTLSNVIVTLTANFYLVYILKMGITGALYATLFGSITTFAISFPYIVTRINFSQFSFSILKKILIFGLPFLPSVIFQMIIDYSDRIILLNLTDMDMVGIYSAGYKIGGLMLLLISGFRLGWEPYFLKLENDEKRSEIISAVLNNVILFLFMILLFTVLFAEPILKTELFGFTLLGKEYWKAINLIPIIMFGYIFLGFYYIQLPGIYYFNKTKVLPVFRGCAATLNIILNFVLIPHFGLFGAAIATTFSFCFMSVLIYYYTQKFFQINFNWKIIIYYFLFSLIIYLISINYTIYLGYSIIIYLIAVIPLFYYLISSMGKFKKLDRN